MRRPEKTTTVMLFIPMVLTASKSLNGFLLAVLATSLALEIRVLVREEGGKSRGGGGRYGPFLHTNNNNNITIHH